MPDCEDTCCRPPTCIGGGCVSPALEFTIPRGRSPLANDRRIAVSLPVGEISEQGLEEIRLQVQNHPWDTGLYGDEALRWAQMAGQLHTLGSQWKDAEGMSYTKRLSRMAYQEFQIKVLPSLLTQVGNIARAHYGGGDYRIAVTRDLNQPPEEFGYDGSCWWTSDHYTSRCAAKTNGVFGLRSFKFKSVLGRSWVLPLRRDGVLKPTFKPTFDAMKADAFVTFNGYGNLDGTTPARIMAHMTGLPYRKIDFGCDPMYVNSEAGYLLAAKEILDTTTAIYLDVDRHANLYETERVEVAS